MKQILMIAVCCFTSMLTIGLTPAQAQNNEKKELVQLTVEQRWQRSSWLFDLVTIAGINHAKSMGKTAKDYGKFIGELFSPSWEGVTTPWGMIRGMHRNNQLTPGCEMEILKESKNAITVRFNRAYKSRFEDDGLSYGVSLKEFEQSMKVFHTTVAEHLGFSYNQRLEGDWNVITIKKKK